MKASPCYSILFPETCPSQNCLGQTLVPQSPLPGPWRPACGHFEDSTGYLPGDGGGFPHTMCTWPILRDGHVGSSPGLPRRGLSWGGGWGALSGNSLGCTGVPSAPRGSICLQVVLSCRRRDCGALCPRCGLSLGCSLAPGDQPVRVQVHSECDSDHVPFSWGKPAAQRAATDAVKTLPPLSSPPLGLWEA